MDAWLHNTEKSNSYKTQMYIIVYTICDYKTQMNIHVQLAKLSIFYKTETFHGYKSQMNIQ